MRESTLEQIPGIGKTRREQLLRRFHSVRAVSQAERAELEQILPKNAADAVYRHFHPPEEDTPCE